jgi:leucyl-tRNA synthetase
LSNALDKKERLAKTYYIHFIKLLAPFAPHITEEIWRNFGNKKSIHLESWQKANISKIQTAEVLIIVQVNGKVRGEFKAESTISDILAQDKAQNLPEIKKWTEGKEVKKVIYVKGKLVNIVVG